MKRKDSFLLLLILALIYSGCTSVEFDNPIDPKGSNYVGDTLAADDDGDGIANYFDDDDGDGIPNYKDPDSKYYIGEVEQGDNELVLSVNIGFNDTIIEPGNKIVFAPKIESSLGLQLTKFDYDGDGIFDDSSALANPQKEYIYAKTGVYKAVVLIKDKAGNIATDTATIQVVIYDENDNTPPVIVLIGGDTVKIKEGDSYTAYVSPNSGYIAYDITSTGDTVDLTSLVDVEDNVNNNVAGEYIIVYTVSDLAGNKATATRVVIVEQNNIVVGGGSAPIISFEPDTLVIPLGARLTDDILLQGVSAFDKEDGDLTKEIQIVDNNIDVSTPGIYEITYQVEDNSGNITQATRVAVVKSNDVTPPVITLEGQSTIYVQTGDPYKEPGYTAEDDTDGDITDKVVVTVTDENGNEVDINTFTNTEGTYTITYKVTDLAGNVGTAERTVIVSDTPANTLTIANKGDEITGLSEGHYIVEIQFSGSFTIAFERETGSQQISVTVSDGNTTVSATDWFVQFDDFTGPVTLTIDVQYSAGTFKIKTW